MNGSPLHGLIHPEMGHIRIPHNRAEDPFPGACPFHGNCLEGLASGLAMELRWGLKAQFLEPEHPAWTLEARYLALGLANLVCVLSPRGIVAGGGVMHNLELFPMIRKNLRECLNGYVQAPDIVPPLLGDNAGVLGGIALAETCGHHLPGVISIHPSAGTRINGSPSRATVTRNPFPERGASISTIRPLANLTSAGPLSNSRPKCADFEPSTRTNRRLASQP